MKAFFKPFALEHHLFESHSEISNDKKTKWYSTYINQIEKEKNPKIKKRVKTKPKKSGRTNLKNQPLKVIEVKRTPEPAPKLRITKENFLVYKERLLKQLLKDTKPDRKYISDVRKATSIKILRKLIMDNMGKNLEEKPFRKSPIIYTPCGGKTGYKRK